MVEPFDLGLVNPASIDVRLGGHLMIEVADQRDLIEIDISKRTAEHPYWLLPNEFCLAETLETFNLPRFISAQFVLNQAAHAKAMSTCLLDSAIQVGMAANSRLNSKMHADFTIYLCILA